jgi:glycosyltransferase involved in cell wall biosynthesis
MRVVHVVPALFGPHGIVGGAERYAFELARHMATEVPTTLVTFGDEDREERTDNLRVQVIGQPWYVRGQRTNPFSFRIFRALRDADVVHCHQQHVITSSAVALWCRATGRRVFVSDLGGGGWDISAYLSTDEWYDGHLHLSEYSRHVYGQDRERRARVIAGGVDVQKFSPDPSEVRDGALFVGRLLPHKGVEDLVRALPPDIALTVVGPQPTRDTALRLAALAQGKAVTFKHDLSDEALVQEYRRALCVVLPSVYHAPDGTETRVPELLGQTLLEGMACEAPTICTDVASLPEVVEDGVTGFVVPPNDPGALGEKLRWLREHPEQAREMGRAGRRRVVERFTWPHVVRRCFEAYNGAVPSRSVARQFAALVMMLVLVAGFARGAWTIAGQYRNMLEQPAAKGPYASTDWYLMNAGPDASQRLLRVVAAARISSEADLAFAAPPSPTNGGTGAFWQFYLTISYLLYPQRVWPEAGAVPATASSIHEIAPGLTVVEISKR